MAPLQLFEYLTANPLLFILVLAWVVFWKGMALWTAARNSHKAWFIVMLVVNLLGLLEIAYLAFWSKPQAKA